MTDYVTRARLRGVLGISRQTEYARIRARELPAPEWVDGRSKAYRLDTLCPSLRLKLCQRLVKVPPDDRVVWAVPIGGGAWYEVATGRVLVAVKRIKDHEI